MGSHEVVPMTSGELAERISKLTDHLDHFGDLTVTDFGQRRGIRRIEYILAAPGVPGVHDEIVGLYREWFLKERGDWAFFKYTYEYLDRLIDARLAFHLHLLGATARPVPHAHCGPLSVSALADRVADETDGHLRAIPMALTEANDTFMGLYFAGRAPDCSALRPLKLPDR